MLYTTRDPGVRAYSIAKREADLVYYSVISKTRDPAKAFEEMYSTLSNVYKESLKEFTEEYNE